MPDNETSFSPDPDPNSETPLPETAPIIDAAPAPEASGSPDSAAPSPVDAVPTAPADQPEAASSAVSPEAPATTTPQAETPPAGVSAPPAETPAAPAPLSVSDENLAEKFLVQMHDWRVNLAEATAKREEKKQQREDAILELAQKSGAITNKQVQKALGCSNIVARRYLAGLAKAGKLKRTGGLRSASYEAVE